MPKEHLYSLAFEEILCRFCSNLSYRKSCTLLNAILHRLPGMEVKTSTLNEHIECHGRRAGEILQQKAQQTLQQYSISSQTGRIENPDLIPDCVKCPDRPAEEAQGQCAQTRFKEQIACFNEGREDCDQIKEKALIEAVETHPENCVYVSIDDVGVDHQKDARRDGGRKQGKVVENTVVHIQTPEGCYLLTAIGMKKAFSLVVAFLLSNHLLENRHLYIFSDGAQNIRKNIEAFFSFCPYTLMLDWYHLEKKMTELLSMALKGSKDARHEIRNTLNRKLWAGNVDDAVTYLKNLGPEFIKNPLRLEDAVNYLGRKKPYVPCYALRSVMDYRNSSNPVEKANDLIVAGRQKHNGMSWSYTGSGSLAILSALLYNGELNSWLANHQIPFTVPDNLPLQEAA